MAIEFWMTRNPMLSLVAILGLSGCDMLTSPAERVARAEQLMAAGEYGGAQVELRNAIGNSPSDVSAQIASARLGLQTGDLDSADRALQLVAKLATETPVTVELRARLMLERGQFEQLLGLSAADNSGLGEPTRSLYRARALQGLRRHAEALELFASIVKSEPSLVAARVGLAESRWAIGDRVGAIAEAETAVAGSSNSADAWLALGSLQQQVGESGDAEASWTKALEFAPGKLTLVRHIGLFGTLAEARLARNDLSGARALYDGVVKVAPQSVPTRLLEAQIAIAAGNAEATISGLQRMVSEYPQSPTLRIVLAAAFLSQDNLQQALIQLEELTLQLPEDVQLKRARDAGRDAAKNDAGSSKRWLGIGMALSFINQPSAARIALAKALSADPTSMDVAVGLITLDLRIGDTDQAVSHAMSLREKYPREPAAAALLGDAYATGKRYAEAEKAYLAAWELKQDAPTALALFRIRQQGKLGRETESLERLLAASPNQTGIRAVYAEALRVAGNDRGAIAQLERVTTEAPGNPIAWNNLAWLYLQKGDTRALAAARRAYELAPQSAQVADTYGWVLVQNGKHQDALKMLQVAVASSKNQPQIAYHYAVALARTGAREQARKLLTEALETKTVFAEREAAQELLAAL